MPSEVKSELVLNRLEGIKYAKSHDIVNWIASGGWDDRTVGAALRQQAETNPETPAFISEDRKITFAELDNESSRTGAALLELGLIPGDRVIVQLGTTIETVIAITALYKVGLIPVCAIPQYREVEIRQLIQMSDAKGYIIQDDFGSFDLAEFADRMRTENSCMKHVCTIRGARPEFGPELSELAAAISLEAASARLELVKLGSGDVLSFQLSGGTTGIPKIIPRFHGEYLAHSAGAMKQFGFGGKDRMIWPLPLLHNAGQVYAMIPPLAMGSSTVILPRFDVPSLFEMIERHSVTHAISVGPVAAQILNYSELTRHDFSTLKLFATMSGAKTLEEYIGVPCVNLFGITEGLLLGSQPNDDRRLRHESNGHSGVIDDEIKLIDLTTGALVPDGSDGELVFRGPSSLTNYYGAPDATAEALDQDGFVKTGDIMRVVNVSGRRGYSFQGRTRDNVNRGGEKIGCEEVERFVTLHPDVAEARLVAMPDPIYGEKGCIFIITRPDARIPSVKELCAFLVAQGLAKFKCPERVEAIEEFPVTRVGKLDRPALRLMICEMLKREANQR